MREKNQVVLPIDLGICIPEGDFLFKAAEICENLDYTELFKSPQERYITSLAVI
jgi:hypothetical protein